MHTGLLNIFKLEGFFFVIWKYGKLVSKNMKRSLLLCLGCGTILLLLYTIISVILYSKSYNHTFFAFYVLQYTNSVIKSI